MFKLLIFRGQCVEYHSIHFVHRKVPRPPKLPAEFTRTSRKVSSWLKWCILTTSRRMDLRPHAEWVILDKRKFFFPPKYWNNFDELYLKIRVWKQSWKPGSSWLLKSHGIWEQPSKLKIHEIWRKKKKKPAKLMQFENNPQHPKLMENWEKNN